MKTGVASRAERDAGAVAVGKGERRVARVAEGQGWRLRRLNTARVRVMP